VKKERKVVSRKKWRKPKIFVCSTDVDVFTAQTLCTAGSGAVGCVSGNNQLSA